MVQTAIYNNLAYGVAGEIVNSGPIRAQNYVLNSADASYNVFGRAFTVDSEGVAKAGGTGTFAGIMVSPKENMSYGTSAGGPLAPTMTLANAQNATMLTMGEIYVQLPDVAAIGDLVTYNTTTGALASVLPSGAITASQATTVLTVTAVTAGLKLGIGSVVNTESGPVTVISLGTGTGGTGTYNVNVSQTVSSASMVATSAAGTGFAFVPNCKVSRFTVATAGLAAVVLTN